MRYCNTCIYTPKYWRRYKLDFGINCGTVLLSAIRLRQICISERVDSNTLTKACVKLFLKLHFKICWVKYTLQ